MKNLEKKINLLVAPSGPQTGRKSVKEALAAELNEGKTVVTTSRTVGQEVDEMLREIGVPCSIMGHRRLHSAICLAVENPTVCDCISNGLYPMVAKLEGNGATASQVERAMRHAIELAWVRGDMKVFEKYFGNTICPNKGKPTNGEFIAQLANHARSRMQTK